MLTLAAQVPGWVQAVLVVLFLIVCLFLILTVLIQRPTGGGLVGAFGSGAGSGQTAFGTKTGDALTMVTIGMFVLFLLFGIGLNYALRPVKAPVAAEQPQQTPATTPTPETPATTNEAPKVVEPAPEAAPVTPAAPK